jgi:hypothetical protein
MKTAKQVNVLLPNVLVEKLNKLRIIDYKSFKIVTISELVRLACVEYVERHDPSQPTSTI